VVAGNLDSVPLAVQRKLDAICDSFEADLMRGGQPCVDEYVDSVEREHRVLLHGLLAEIHMELSKKRGHRASEQQRHPIPEILGRYRIEKILGEGAMGTVYLARDSQLERRVALKIPKVDDNDVELTERFYREARAAATLHHRNICPVHDIGEFEGVRYISMAYIDGHPLSAYVDSAKQQSERSIAIIARKLAIALEAAHHEGVIHRDLKPANIMVDKQNEPVIMDFGLARQLNKNESSRLTQNGSILGSPAYMSPEQVSGDINRVGPSSDIYSLGVIVYELCTGRVPFDGPITAVLGQILTQEPEKPSTFRPDLDPRLEAICVTMMAKQPEDRYHSMVEVAQVLTGFIKSKCRTHEDAAGAVPIEGNTSNSSRLDGSDAKTNDRLTPKRSTATPSSTVAIPEVPAEVGSSKAIARIAKRRLPGWTWAVAGVAGALLLWSATLLFRGDEKTGLADKFQTASVPGDRARDTRANALLPPLGHNEKSLVKDGAQRPESIEAEVSTDEPREGPPHNKPKPQTTALPESIVNSFGMTFPLIPAGEFQMGSPETDPDASPHEQPQHRVRITKPFYMAAYEVTQDDYRRVIPESHNRKTRAPQLGGRYPVEEITWEEATAFCRRLSEISEEKAAGRSYRLPTEAEWEFACRAGTTTRYFTGNKMTPAQANYGDSVRHSSPVGSYKSNAFGLFDMVGNVEEWCSDFYSTDYYDQSPNENPGGPATGRSHVLRGGHWLAKNEPPFFCRSAYRGMRENPTPFYIGVRVVLVLSND
jgi:serine/threonine protein kinase